jgi:hypothetical protein
MVTRSHTRYHFVYGRLLVVKGEPKSATKLDGGAAVLVAAEKADEAACEGAAGDAAVAKSAKSTSEAKVSGSYVAPLCFSHTVDF